jgi:DNA-binding transcriptional ArsR family regulator
MNDRVFRALADPTRRRILELLRAGPLSAGEIAAHFPASQPTISRHLQVLKQAELVRDERHGQYILYHLNATVLQSWLEWLWEHWGGMRKG